MLNLSYNLSWKLREKLQLFAKVRQDILLFPISPKDELVAQWNNLIDRTYSSLSLAGNPLSKTQITKLFSSSYDNPKIKLNKNEKDVIGYKKAQEYIAQNWLVNRKNVTLKDILMLYDIFCDGSLKVSLSRVQELLDYLQAHEENPIIQAGVANLGIVKIRPFSNGNGRLARLISLLFLYKHGFDVRKLAGPEIIWARERETFEEIAVNAQNTASITLWLEYFAESLIAQLQEAFERIKSGAHNTAGLSSSFWELNSRQKKILARLEEPGLTITNRDVQKQFKISQITASRDLSKLTSLGLIFSHGKGRSIYYTKV